VVNFFGEEKCTPDEILATPVRLRNCYMRPTLISPDELTLIIILALIRLQRSLTCSFSQRTFSAMSHLRV